MSRGVFTGVCLSVPLVVRDACGCMLPPLQRHIVLTALDIARGLAYLHHPDRRLVHRDLSAANVLLATASGDERGFRALVSDFGGWLGVGVQSCTPRRVQPRRWALLQS